MSNGMDKTEIKSIPLAEIFANNSYVKINETLIKVKGCQFVNGQMIIEI